MLAASGRNASPPDGGIKMHRFSVYDRSQHHYAQALKVTVCGATNRVRRTLSTKTERTKEWQSYNRLVPRDRRDGALINHSDKFMVGTAV